MKTYGLFSHLYRDHIQPRTISCACHQRNSLPSVSKFLERKCRSVENVLGTPVHSRICGKGRRSSLCRAFSLRQNPTALNQRWMRILQNAVHGGHGGMKAFGQRSDTNVTQLCHYCSSLLSSGTFSSQRQLILQSKELSPASCFTHWCFHQFLHDGSNIYYDQYFKGCQIWVILSIVQLLGVSRFQEKCHVFQKFCL